MDFYEDKTKDGVGSNWINASGDNISEITKFTFSSDTASDYGAASAANYIKLYNYSTLVNFWFNDGAGDSAGDTGTWVVTTINNSGSKNDFASDFAKVVNAQSGFSANVASNIVYVTASTAGVATAHVLEVGTIAGLSAEVHVSGANATAWTSAGGDYHASPTFTKSFSSGLEDLELDVSELVEQWIAGTKSNYGFGVKLTDSTEAAAKSFFTKKFFGRDSEFLLQRPVLEARWDSARRDDRGSFYASSSLAPAEDNLNTLFLYNRIRGRLRNIPAVGTNAIRVSLYSSAGGTKLGSTFTGSHVSTGIYSCNVTASTTATSLVDVWHSGGVEYFTGSLSVKSFNSKGYNPEDTYVLSMPSLRKQYRKDQTHRLNLYVREKNWSPNIHTQAVRSSIPSLIIPSASFQLRRCIDDYVVVPYGTGSTTEPAYTALSHDVSGNYFDLDTTYLEAGYLYDIQYSFYDEENGWEEQPYRFKFRVVD
ncbi:MAG TPA: hypothetical protein DCM40_00990 [Maribacter sp.]|nr:hypothetical protein [Maribacter sp.]